MAEVEEKDIITRLKGLGKGSVYEDSAFPASEKFLYHTGVIPEYDSKLGDVKWIRPENIVKDPKYLLESCGADVKIECGSLDNVWLVGTLALLVAHSGERESSLLDLMYLLFIGLKANNQCKCLCNRCNPEPLRDRCRYNNELWSL